MSGHFRINGIVRINNAKGMQEKTEVLTSMLTNMLLILRVRFCCRLLGFLHHMWSTELQNGLMLFYAFKWFGMPRGMWRYPSRQESFQSKELGNLCLISEHSIIATCFTPSTFKGTTFPWWLCFPFNCTICCLKKKKSSQGYVNKTLCSCGSKFISASIDSQTHDIEILFYFL